MQEQGKILFIIDSLETGGAEKSLLDIMSRFKKFTPIVCSVYCGNHLQPSYEAAGIQVISLNLKGRYDYTKAVTAVEEIIKKERIDIIHTTLFRSDRIGRILKKKTGLPLINSFVSNSYSFKRFQQMSALRAVKHLLLLFQNRFTASNVDLFISNSQVIKKSNSKALGVSEHKVKVIYRGRDYNKINTVNQDIVQGLAHTYKKNKEFVYLNISRLIPTKGQADLIRAFRAVYQKNNTARLLIAGEGPARAALEKLIQDLHLSTCVFLLGNRNDIPELLHISDCFVFPSSVEGLPGSIIEAMMAGKIIIASSIAENLECVDADSALLFKAGDIGAMRAHMNAVIEQPFQFEQLAVNARAVAVKKFDIHHIAGAYEAVYDELLHPAHEN